MASNDQRDQWDTLTNPMGNKLHILSPTQYTFEEHKWLQKRHNNRSKLDIIPKEASAPKDRRTAVIEWLDHTLYCNPKLKQKMDAPLDYQLEMQRLHVASKLAELRSGPPQDTLEGTMPEPELQGYAEGEALTMSLAWKGDAGLHGHPSRKKKSKHRG